MYQPVIETTRLELHHIPVDGLISLFDEKLDELAIAGRDFTNPHRILLEDSGPLAWRVPQAKADPDKNFWFVRLMVLKSSREIIGSTSFHGAPDVDGMIEIGLGIDEKFWNQGFATEALTGMWGWVCRQDGVRTLRYTVSPTNIASVRVIEKFGFHYMGQQMDEIDGPEDIYEMSVEEFLKRAK